MTLSPWRTRDPITAPRLNAIQAAIPTIRAGVGVTTGTAAGTTTVGLWKSPQIAKWQFWAFIDDSASIGQNQWEYYFTEAVKSGPGYAGWTIRPDGRTGVAYNLAEVPNDGVDIEGNGIDMANLPSGFSMKPAAPGVPVLLTVMLVPNGEDSLYEYWFNSYNAVDGTCEEPAP